MTPSVLGKLENRLVDKIEDKVSLGCVTRCALWHLLRNPYDLTIAFYKIKTENIESDRRGLAQAIIKNAALNAILALAFLGGIGSIIGTYFDICPLKATATVVSAFTVCLTLPTIVKLFWQ